MLTYGFLGLGRLSRGSIKTYETDALPLDTSLRICLMAPSHGSLYSEGA